jgi:hypothetical protein
MKPFKVSFLYEFDKDSKKGLFLLKKENEKENEYFQ